MGWRFGFAIILTASITPLYAGGVGTTTADILKINYGARPAAMGGAYTAMGDDAYSIDYNPAGLVMVRASQLIITHLDSLADISYEYLTFATAWGTDNVLAVNTAYRHMPPIDNQPGDPSIKAVNSDDVLISGTYATKFDANIRAGLTIKYLQSDLATFSASAVAFDIGFQLDKLPYGIRAGLAVQNLGTGMTFNPASSADQLPMFIRIGIGDHQVIEGNRDLNIGVEIFKPADQDIKMGVGGEFWMFPELFAVRAGYKFESLGKTTGNVFDNYTLGCTLTRRIDDDDFSIDIAYDPATFGSTSQDTFFFGLNFKFNQLRIF
jgi:hypothetical protein